jgi:phage-related protein
MSIYFPSAVSNLYATSGARIPNPSRPFNEGIKTNTITFMSDSGHEQRRQRGNSKRVFDLTFAVLSKDQYFTIRDFFMQVTNVNAFLWLHPIEKTQILVKFAMDTFAGSNKGHGPAGPWYELQVKLEQVWD